MTHKTNFMLFSSLLAFMLLLFSCDDDNNTVNPPALSGDNLEFTQGRGTDVDITFDVEAEEGIQSLTLSVNGGGPEELDIEEGAEMQSFTHTFTIPAESVLGDEFNLLFTLTDQAGQEQQIDALVTTGKLIETPDTYVFTRDGENTVHHPGQTDRLDMVEEIKAYLGQGDAGEKIFEQDLLDMFENTGGNGGGNFSFTSDRQLKNKTFAVDLDDRLFENLFASAEAASENGSQGIEASNGTAGLIVRENSGKTILLDENGHEFVQFIEKGLMGAVFYNQIYNVYLTDSRTGDDVENIDFREGSNDTPMEHGWDEAFGYWDPPLDFTSPWPDERGDEDRFWSHYSNVVDNVKDGQLGTNEIIMSAYKEGRAAVVNNDLQTKNEQREILYENLELVAAATTVHYINLTLTFLNESKTGEAFHVLSEAWAFANALRYSPNRKITVNQVEEIKNTHFGENGNFWNVTPSGLNTAKSILVDIYPKLEPVQDDL